jgi:hypothetical protein
MAKGGTMKRRRGSSALAVMALAGAACGLALAGVASSSDRDELARTLKADTGFPADPDHGPASGTDLRVLRQFTDTETGVTWAMKSYQSPQGLCLDVEASRSGSPVGSVGGCRRNPDLGLATLLAGVTPTVNTLEGQLPENLFIGAGGLALDATHHYQVISGAVPCACNVRVSWADGFVTTDAGHATFMAIRQLDTPVGRAPRGGAKLGTVEILDAGGGLVASRSVP